MSKYNYTVLYVEDEKGDRENMSQYFRSRCKNTLEAVNGEEAYEIFKEKKPDIIITDIQMPKMDGLELIEKIRKVDEKIPIIVLSAHTEKDKLMKAMKLNLIDYIVKPITRSSLKKAMDEACLIIEKNTKIDMLDYDELLEAIIVFDKQNIVLDCNKSAPEMFGYENKSEVIGLSGTALGLINKNLNIYEARENKVYTDNEIYLQKKDKNHFLAKTQSKIIVRNFQELRVVSVLDLSVMHEFSTDKLTKLRTRKMLEFKFANTIKKCHLDNEPICLILIDIAESADGKSAIKIGDKDIKSIADVLLYSVRGSDIVARWSEDEFVIVLINSSLHQAKKIAESLKKSIDRINTTKKLGITPNITANSMRYEDTLINALKCIKEDSKSCIDE